MKLKFTILFLILFPVLSGSGKEPATLAQNQLSNNERVFLLNMVNQARSRGCNCGSQKMPPTGLVSWSEQLESAAEKHSQDMAKHRFMDHNGSDRSTFSARITKAGFKWTSCAENIAEGYESVEDVLNGWLNSPLHCKNLMNPHYRFMGVARVGNYWTQDFGGK